MFEGERQAILPVGRCLRGVQGDGNVDQTPDSLCPYGQCVLLLNVT